MIYYKSARDAAAEKCKDAYFNGEQIEGRNVQCPDDSFKAGSDWCLTKSDIVNEMRDTLDWIVDGLHHIRSDDDNYGQTIYLITRIEKTLQLFEKSREEIENE